MIKKSVVLLVFFISTLAQADITVNNLSSSDVEKIMNDITANFAFTSGAGAAPLGNVFGFELGLIAGSTTTAGLDTVAKQASTSNSVPSLLNVGLLGRLSFPMGITAELSMLPSLSAAGATLGSTGFALSWASTGWLIDIGVKGHYTTSKFEFSQTTPISSSISIEDKITGAQLFISKGLVFMEPYFGIGTVSGDGTMSATTTVFTSTSSSETSKVHGTHMTVGSEFKLGFVKMGLEYASLLGTTRYAAKFAFYF